MTDGVLDSEPPPPRKARSADPAAPFSAARGAVKSAAIGAAGAAARNVSRLISGARRGAANAAVAVSALATRIFVFALAAFAIQIAGLLFVSEYRKGLIELKSAALVTQAEMIAVIIADQPYDPLGREYDPVYANEVIRRLAVDTSLRAQLFTSSGRLTGDSRALLGNTIVIEDDSFAPQADHGGATALLDALGEHMIAAFREPPPLAGETPPAGLAERDEVYVALNGQAVQFESVNSEGELILSVAVPIRRVRLVMGALVLSTEGGDIGALTDKSLDALLQGFGVAALVTLLLSMVLAHQIARPIRQLAQAADDGGRRQRSPRDAARVDIPDLSHRNDEIGDLSIALRRMTDALYLRIDAIENFAADVAHEIKNPLTSMRSAVESFRSARNDDQRAQLLNVIEQDVRRMDRLVTDISNASRLDAELVREHREEFDLLKLLKTVVAITEAVCEDRAVRIELDASVKRANVRGLEERLAQVFLNLLDNAASFSPSDGVITVRLAAHRMEQRDAWRVDVVDEGPGVPPENLESVFERFYSERPEEHGFGKHSGLGLNICRQIVDAHGGRIWCENRSDRSGAMFSTVLPV